MHTDQILLGSYHRRAICNILQSRYVSSHFLCRERINAGKRGRFIYPTVPNDMEIDYYKEAQIWACGYLCLRIYVSDTKKQRIFIRLLSANKPSSIALDITVFVTNFLSLNNISAEALQICVGLSLGIRLMVACACTFKPVIDELILVWRRMRGLDRKESSSDSDESPHVDTIGRARNRRVDLETVYIEMKTSE